RVLDNPQHAYTQRLLGDLPHLHSGMSPQGTDGRIANPAAPAHPGHGRQALLTNHAIGETERTLTDRERGKMPDPHEPARLTEAESMTRRQLLQAGGAGLLALSGSGLLAACSSGTATGASSTTGGGSPVHGGTLRFGAQGGANTDSLEADNV